MVEQQNISGGVGSIPALFLLHFIIFKRKGGGTLNNLVYNSKIFLKRNGGTILTVLGCVGVTATTIVAIKSTPKALKLLNDAKEEKGDELTALETIKIAGPVYIPTITLGSITIMCVLSANMLNNKKQASIAGAYTLLNKTYNQYRDKIKELYGDDVDRDIIDDITIEKAEEVNVYADNFVSNSSLNVNTDKNYLLFYDSFSNRIFESTMEQVLIAEYSINRNFVLRGVALLNEFYEFLGLSETDSGDSLAWTIEDEVYWIDFNHRESVLKDGRKCIIIETLFQPGVEWQTYRYM